MDDVEGYGEVDLAANVYDDDYLSSDGENVADVTIDLLEDEEFPDMLDQEEISHHALAMNTYEHELEDSSRSGGVGFNGYGGDVQSQLQQQPQQVQLQQQQQQQQIPSQRHIAQQSQHSPLTSERKLSRDRERDPSHALKGRKSEAFSRLPMPKSFQQHSSASGIPTLQHRHSNSTTSGRNNPPNTSPPLGGKSREPKPSPSEMISSPGPANDYISQKGGSSVSPIAVKQHPSVNTKHGHSSSASSNNNGPISAGSASGGGDMNNVSMTSPTSPKVALSSSVSSGTGQQNGSSSSSSRNWSTAEMDDFIREHRIQLRDCGELTKRETKLLANVTLGMSSSIHAQTTGFSNNRESFMKYLDELDEIVDEKLITIVTMSQKLKALRGHGQT
ncbi:hypothetical protein BC939DRAFT_78291 [Gamsiella multidivaricata]|uniref:uncharacterized protein n=1 Tax=Gamsiella multidivaricata TaxID=101098 RepID=UPI00221EDAF3|nr:uncharacterized protein BC939DRAFT_78291 [Gamsiella multidivaricata]KAI7828054.1 hypothetical protein BC939DRAFT_78291 [Gamsiella multidivaricata]